MIFGACLQMVSKNAKLSRITYEPGNGRYLRPVAHGEHAASTYASILGTCPQSCPHLDAGCYAQSGITGGVVRKLDEAVRLFGYSHDQVIEQEAWLIATRKPPRGRVIRVHVSGDARTRWAARQLAEAVRTWNVNEGGPGFTYTHGPTRRDDWGGISVLASVEDVNGIRDARRRGSFRRSWFPSIDLRTISRSLERASSLALPRRATRRVSSAGCALTTPGYAVLR